MPANAHGQVPSVFLLWSAIAVGAAVAIAAGYVGFGSLSEAWPPRLRAVNKQQEAETEGDEQA